MVLANRILDQGITQGKITYRRVCFNATDRLYFFKKWNEDNIANCGQEQLGVRSDYEISYFLTLSELGKRSEEEGVCFIS